MKMRKRKERDSYLDEKNVASSPKNLPSRLSSAFRTGNAMTIKFNPPKSSDAPTPRISALRRPEDFPVSSSSSNMGERSQARISESDLTKLSTSSTYSNPPAWPLNSSSAQEVDISASRPLSADFTLWPLKVDAPSPAPQSPEQRREPPTLNLLDVVKTNDTILYTSPTLKDIFDEHDVAPVQKIPEDVEEKTDTASSPLWQRKSNRETPDEIVFNPFDDEIEEWDTQQVDKSPISELLVEKTPTEVFSEDQTEELAIAEEPAHEEVTNPFKDWVQESVEESVEGPVNHQTGENVIGPSPDLVRPTIEPQAEDWSFEQLLPQQPTRVPKAGTLAQLQREDQARSSTVPEIDKLLRIVAQENEQLADKPLFWTDFGPVEEEVELAMEIPQIREHEGVREVSPVKDSS
jgi:hypothetical protein